jgi:CheY-like chemotaxis protein
MPEQLSTQSKKSVLIIEDEAEFAEILSERLRQEGFAVQSCDCVPEANLRIKNQRFDCIVVDIRLAKGTGDQVITYTRRFPENLNYKTPILVTSGELEPDLLKRIGKDIQGALVKPFPLNSLTEKVKALCQK